ncbi:isochorismatase family cysteine hydrolase [Anaerovibrio sp.]|uniref:cysteine hydrolase family protein n=1 Tax=Anaerovibrio sp. TaxID=1872532 RepID=UPI0025BA9124|nr:isochorismatase family cysteine hydrolase [Anaerovibrio sp.]
MKSIVVVDMQNDFIDGSLGTKEAQKMLPRLKDKLKKVVEDGSAELVFTMDTHGKDYLNTQEGKKLPVEHCIKGTQGWEISPELGEFVAKAKAVVEKPTFGSMELIKHLKAADEVELVGLCTDICVISNALLIKAAYPEMKVSVDAQCCAGVTPESHANALDAMKMCQVEIR